MEAKFSDTISEMKSEIKEQMKADCNSFIKVLQNWFIYKGSN